MEAAVHSVFDFEGSTSIAFFDSTLPGLTTKQFLATCSLNFEDANHNPIYVQFDLTT